MDSFEFDNVKAEKEDASWRYNMERKLRFGLRLFGFLLVLFLLSWYWFPTLILETVEVAGDFRRRFISIFNQPLFNFIVVNVIILVVYLLSSQKQTQKQTASADIYDEYVSSRRSGIPTSAVATVTEENRVDDKQIILVENAVAVSPVKQQQLTTIPTVIKTTKLAVSSSTDDQVKQKTYRRTRSMVSESRNQRRPRELGRSETAMISSELVISGTEPPGKSVDDMSSEEFQLKIDNFIAKTKKTLMQENTAHYTKMKENCMYVVVKN